MSEKVRDIHKTEYRDGDVYWFWCPTCNDKIEIATWEKNKRCSCGLVWNIRHTFEAVGTPGV